MYKDILLTITGIQVFPIISLVLFVIVFTSILIATLRMDRARAERFATLPLDDAAVRDESVENRR